MSGWMAVGVQTLRLWLGAQSDFEYWLRGDAWILFFLKFILLEQIRSKLNHPDPSHRRAQPPRPLVGQVT
jgi:hypothetical protein